MPVLNHRGRNPIMSTKTMALALLCYRAISPFLT
jgi:hypothetical protein